MAIGFRVYTDVARPPRQLVDQFEGLPPANIGDCMHRSRCMHPTMRYMGVLGGTLLGTAVTVRTAPGDNLLVHGAMDIAQEGDVIVVDAGGDLSHAIVGEMMALKAQQKGLRGFVIDGAMRDVAGIRALGLPMYARGATPAGPYKDGPGEVNVEISCGGVVVRPGDILVGDEDGIVVIPKEEAEAVLEAAKVFHAREVASAKRLTQEPWKPSGRLEILASKGCEFIGSERGGA
jgi:RraA family protein